MVLSYLSPLSEADPGAPSGGPGSEPAPAPQPPQPQPQAQSVATLTQEQFNAALAEERRKWKAQQDAAAEKARKEAEDKAALEKGEFERLATERGTRLTQLEAEHATATERLAAYEAEMGRQIKARLRALPEEIRSMAPEGDALTQFAWLEKAESAAAKLSANAIPGTPRGPQGSGAPSAGGASPDLRDKKRQSNEYAL